MSEYITTVNGHPFSFSSITLEAPGPDPVKFERFVAIDYEHSLEVGEVRGLGPVVLAEASGEYRTRASLTMYLADWRDLRLRLARMDGFGGWMQKPFNIRVVYAEEGEAAIEDELRYCRIIRASKAYRRGNEPLMVSIDLYVREIVEEGLRAVHTSDDDTIAQLSMLGV